MEIIGAERGTIHGGTIIVYAAKKGKQPISNRVVELIRQEENFGLYKKKMFTDFAARVKKNKLAIQKLILDIKSHGKSIVGIGAPAKGNTLINYCNLDQDLIDYLAEKSELKIGTFSPGMHIPVIDESRLFKDQPDYALMLSWNIADELIPKIRDKGYRGKFIIPHPKPKII